MTDKGERCGGGPRSKDLPDWEFDKDILAELDEIIADENMDTGDTGDEVFRRAADEIERLRSMKRPTDD